MRWLRARHARSRLASRVKCVWCSTAIEGFACCWWRVVACPIACPSSPCTREIQNMPGQVPAQLPRLLLRPCLCGWMAAHSHRRDGGSHLEAPSAWCICCITCCALPFVCGRPTRVVPACSADACTARTPHAHLSVQLAYGCVGQHAISSRIPHVQRPSEH